MTQRVIVDVDAGTDDAVALLLLLTSEPEKDFKIVGITCTHGNTSVDNVCTNVLTTLETINRLDIPVFCGAEGPLIPLEDTNVIFEFFHGENGFGDKQFPTTSKKIQKENAVAAINRIAIENEGITLICLGPLTNIALALRTYPELRSNIREIHLMGGNYQAVGNFSAAAEFNFYKDPEAAHIVLSSLTCPISVLPWETCLNVKISKKERFSDIGSSTQPHIKLLNEIEEGLYKKEEFWCPCDAVLASTFMDKALIKRYENLHMSVELHGLRTRGQGVIDRKKNPNARIITEVDVTHFTQLIFKMASFEPK